MNMLILYLQPQVIRQIRDDFKTCTEVFDTLVAKYHRKELTNRLYTSLKLMSFKMKDASGKIKDHIDSFNNLVVDLQNLGEDLSDERKALHLLSSLPASYQSLSRVLLHRDRDTITYDKVVSALLTDNLQTKLVLSSTPASNSSGTALNVNRGRTPWRGGGGGDRRSKGRSKSRGRTPERKTITCWKCGKAGHMKKDCKGKQVTFASASVATAGEGDEDDLLDDDYAL